VNSLLRTAPFPRD